AVRRARHRSVVSEEAEEVRNYWQTAAAFYLRTGAPPITVAMRSFASRSAVRIAVAAAVAGAIAPPPPPAIAQPPPPAVAPPPPPAGAQGPAPEDLRRAGAEALEDGRLGEALALYERALGPARSDPRVWFDLCLVRYAAGDHGRALDACYRALPGDE